MSKSGIQVGIAADNTSAVTVTVPSGARHFTVSVFAVDSTGAYEAVAGGSADLQARVPGGTQDQTQFETVYQDDGTTAETFDVTAAPESKTIFNTAVTQFRSTPTALTADKRLMMVVNYSTEGNFI